MKNNLITSMGIWVCLSLLSVIGQAQTTSLVVGAVKNGTANITNLENATHVLKANLPDGATVSDLKIEYSEYDAKYFLTARVASRSVSSVGIQLEQSGNTILAFNGPGVEVTCTGYNCPDCRVSFNGGIHCECFRTNGEKPRCDMTSKVNIGF